MFEYSILEKFENRNKQTNKQISKEKNEKKI